MTFKKTIISNSFLYFLSMVVPKAANFIVIPIYSYYIKPDQFAILTYTTSITMLLSVFSQMGFNAYWFRNYANAKNKREHNGAMFWFMLIWSSLILIVSLIFLPIVWKALNISIPYWPYMVISLFTHFLTSLDHIPMRMFRVQNQVQFYLFRMITKSFMSLGLGLLFVVSLNYGIFGRFLAEFIVALLFGLLFILYMLKNADFTLNWRKAKSSLIFSIPIVSSSFFRIGSNSATTIISEKLLTMTSLGIFGMANSLVTIVKVFVQSIGLTIEPEIFLRSNQANFPEQFLKIKNIAIIIVGWIAFGSALFVSDLVFLFLAESYWPSWKLVQLLAIYVILEEEKTILCNLLVAQGKTNSLNYIYGSKFVFLIPFLIFGLNMLYEIGIVLAMIASSLASLLVSIKFIDRSSFNDLGIVRDMKFISIGIIMLIFVNFLRDLSISITISLFIKLAIYMLFILLTIYMYDLSIKKLIANFKK
jgi:O-antigen/teichoic acid export membrane protein